MELAADEPDSWTYGYNSANELTKWTIDGVVDMDFTYDDWGRTVTRSGTVPSDHALRVGDGTVPYFYCQYAGESGSWTVGDRQRTYALVGMLALAETPGTNPSTGSYRYYAQDHLGSLRALFDGDKAWAGTAEYEPYGTIRTGAGPAELPGQLFTGKTLDLETMLYFFPFRYYSPVAARWLTRDPLGMVDGPNVYGYVGENPVGHRDSLGLHITNTFPNPIDGLHPRPRPDEASECFNAAPVSASSGVCCEYGDSETHVGWNARCVCENAGESPWDQYVRGCLACMHRKRIGMNKSHYLCYKAATSRFGIGTTIDQMWEIASQLLVQCFLGHEGT